jgi:hypothetical protein
MVGSCFALALALLAWGCAGTAGKATPLNPVTGQHPANWLQVHYSSYIATPDQCRSCHGSTSDPAQAGGISKVSCFGCHTAGVDHPANWADHMQHGRNGAQLAPVVTVDPAVPVMAGMAHCTKCHGADYKGGIALSCYTCHTTAPHPATPWTDKTNLANSSHTQTDLNNAAACAQCHTAGANSILKPSTTPAAGTAPGCFNNTLCHDNTVTAKPVGLIPTQQH